MAKYRNNPTIIYRGHPIRFEHGKLSVMAISGKMFALGYSREESLARLKLKIRGK